MKKLHIVMCFDENVVVGILTLMLSIKHNNSNVDFVFHLCALNKGLQKFQKLYNLYGDTIGFSLDSIKLHNIEEYKDYHDIESNLQKFLRKGNRNLTVAAFYRLIVFDNLPVEEGQDRFVYFDTDILCDGDISYLAELDFNGCVLAAVPDLSEQLDYAKRELDFTGDNYFNSGFLVVNIEEWRTKNYGKQIIEVLTSKMPRQLDQDVLNLVCSNKVSWLAPIFNSCVNPYDEPCDKALIIHYTGADKPWKPWSITQKPSVQKYRSYLHMLEPDSSKWFDYQKLYENPLSIPSSIHDFKMVGKILTKEHKYIQAFIYWTKHIKVKIQKKGLLGVILGK